MKIFVILSRFPYPLEKGDKLRAYNHIKYLAKNNEIILFQLILPPFLQQLIHLKMLPYFGAIDHFLT